MAEQSITMRLRVPDIPLLSPAQGRAILSREAAAAVQNIVETMATEVRQRSPVGATGILRASVTARVTTGTSLKEAIRGEVFSSSQAPYAPYVEYGTGPHWAPIGPLLLWARRVLGNERAAYAVQRAIARRGTRARNMFRDGFNAVLPRIPGIFEQAMVRAARLLQGGS